MYKIGLSSCSKELSEELFGKYSENGIYGMEISMRRAEYDELDFDEVRRLADKYGVKLWSLHLPFTRLDYLDISRDELAKDTVAYHTELIKKASAVGIERFILHPSGEPIASEDRAHRMQTAKASIARLASVASSCGAVIAVEDLPRTCLGNCSAEILELISVDPSVCVCFDTNHLLFEDPAEFIRNVGDKIVTLHVSDYDFVDERHWLPGEGDIDWKKVFQALKDVDYKGIWLYELGFGSGRHITREQELTCADFYNNAMEIFEGKKPTPKCDPKRA